MSSTTSVTKWLIASAWLATNCFAFNMASFAIDSYWVIPAALVATAFHHGYMLRRLRRSPEQAIPRKYFNTYPFIVLLWVSGGAVSIWAAVYTVTVPHWAWTQNFAEVQIMTSTVIGGVLSLIEAGIVITLWHKCTKLKGNGMTGTFPLGSLDNLDRRVVRTQVFHSLC